MARAKRFTAEQIVAKLREAERLQGQGATIPAVCKKLGVSEQTFYRWRNKYGALKEDEAHRLKALEQESARLKKIVAEQALDISMLKEVARETSEPGATPGGRGTPAEEVQRGQRTTCVCCRRPAPVDPPLRVGARRLRDETRRPDGRAG